MPSAVPVDYKFEVFISYSHSGVVKPWVDNYFLPYLLNWLPHYTGGQPARIFVDEEVTPGLRWPQFVRDALLASKCLVPVLSGDYFFKPWCVSEWTSFVDRENLLGLDITSKSLIVPIVYSDGEWFPDRANEYQPVNFKDCRSNSGNFENHSNFPVFEEKVERLAEAVATVAGRAPRFDPLWPALEVEALPRTVKLMRI